jgi:hypothetical protein
MNKLVALPIAAVVPTAAPTLASVTADAPASVVHPDAELLALADKYVVAEQLWCDLNLKVDRMDGERWKAAGPRPAVLNWRERHVELGLSAR